MPEQVMCLLSELIGLAIAAGKEKWNGFRAQISGAIDKYRIHGNDPHGRADICLIENFQNAGIQRIDSGKSVHSSDERKLLAGYRWIDDQGLVDDLLPTRFNAPECEKKGSGTLQGVVELAGDVEIHGWILGSWRRGGGTQCCHFKNF